MLERNESKQSIELEVEHLEEQIRSVKERISRLQNQRLKEVTSLQQ